MKTANVISFDESEIMYSMALISESKEHLLTFIAACGYNSNHKEYKRLNFLIKNTSDVVKWAHIFELLKNNIEFISKTTDKFKEYKINKLNISLNQFVASCSRSLKNGLENFLQVECDEVYLNKINEKLHSNEMLLTSIYNKCKEDKSYDCPWIIANTNWNLVK